jgi:hypothetical protein
MRKILGLFLLTLGACSSSSSGSSTPSGPPPVIDSLDVPATATQTNGMYTVQGTIKFHDDTDIVNAIHISVPATKTDLHQSIPNAQKNEIGAVLLLEFAGAPKGDLTFQVSVLDSSGRESAATTKTITLQ